MIFFNNHGEYLWKKGFLIFKSVTVCPWHSILGIFNLIFATLNGKHVYYFIIIVIININIIYFLSWTLNFVENKHSISRAI